MPKITGTAREYVLNVLRQYADREVQVSELHHMQPQPAKFSKENLFNLMPKLLADGLVVRTVEGRAVWWAISDAGLRGR
jgi:hypothetical protein